MDVDADKLEPEVRGVEAATKETSRSNRTRVYSDGRNELLEPHTRAQLLRQNNEGATLSYSDVGMLLDAKPPLRLVVRY